MKNILFRLTLILSLAACGSAYGEYIQASPQLESVLNDTDNPCNSVNTRVLSEIERILQGYCQAFRRGSISTKELAPDLLWDQGWEFVSLDFFETFVGLVAEAREEEGNEGCSDVQSTILILDTSFYPGGEISIKALETVKYNIVDVEEEYMQEFLLESHYVHQFLLKTTGNILLVCEDLLLSDEYIEKTLELKEKGEEGEEWSFEEMAEEDGDLEEIMREAELEEDEFAPPTEAHLEGSSQFTLRSPRICQTCPKQKYFIAQRAEYLRSKWNSLAVNLIFPGEVLEVIGYKNHEWIYVELHACKVPPRTPPVPPVDPTATPIPYREDTPLEKEKFLPFDPQGGKGIYRGWTRTHTLYDSSYKCRPLTTKEKDAYLRRARKFPTAKKNYGHEKNYLNIGFKKISGTMPVRKQPISVHTYVSADAGFDFYINLGIDSNGLSDEKGKIGRRYMPKHTPFGLAAGKIKDISWRNRARSFVVEVRNSASEMLNNNGQCDWEPGTGIRRISLQDMSFCQVIELFVEHLDCVEKFKLRYENGRIPPRSFCGPYQYREQITRNGEILEAKIKEVIPRQGKVTGISGSPYVKFYWGWWGSGKIEWDQQGQPTIPNKFTKSGLIWNDDLFPKNSPCPLTAGPADFPYTGGGMHLLSKYQKTQNDHETLAFAQSLRKALNWIIGAKNQGKTPAEIRAVVQGKICVNVCKNNKFQFSWICKDGEYIERENEVCGLRANPCD